ncbi:MAG TPA: ADP-ribose diphosphatase [Gammaproteobacteria bacterium]|nr:ADP-ribose diphosphatase [Gammaproteobacteria bacterium]
MKKQFQILNSSLVYDGFFSVSKYTLRHSLYQGGMSQSINREVFHRGNCVAVLLYDPDKDKVVLIEQFRMGAAHNSQQDEQAWLIEIVAGGIEQGETAEQVAYRESLEEANCSIQALYKVNTFFTSPGGTSEKLTLFCGKIDSCQVGGIYGLATEDEDIKVSVVDASEAYQMVVTGKIMSAIPILAIQWLQLNKQALPTLWQHHDATT